MYVMSVCVHNFLLIYSCLSVRMFMCLCVKVWMRVSMRLCMSTCFHMCVHVCCVRVHEFVCGFVFVV